MSQFQLSVPIFFAKSFFCKALNELPLVVVQNQQKIAFLQKKISTAIWGLIKNPFQKSISISKIKNQKSLIFNLKSIPIFSHTNFNQIDKIKNQKSLIFNLNSKIFILPLQHGKRAFNIWNSSDH